MSTDPSLRSQLRGLAGDWLEAKRRTLAQPISNVDKASGDYGYTFRGQEITEEEMQAIKDMRESGGIVSQLFHAKSLLNFGTGYEWVIDDDDSQLDVVGGKVVTLEEYLDEAFNSIDLLLIDLGEDAFWYPFSALEIVENAAGKFDRLVPIEPWTLYPETDEKGNIIKWEQRTHSDMGGAVVRDLDPRDVVHFVLSKSSARDKVGISEALRNRDEIEAFKENQEAIRQAIELHGFPQRHVKVGREDGAPIRDSELRRVRTIFDPATTDANTAYFTGRDVEIDTLEAHSFDYSAIQEMSMRNITAAMGLPLEVANIGSDGLGAGTPAEIRMSILKLQITANQRNFARQFVDKVIKRVLRDYTEFDETVNIDLMFNEPMDDQKDMADLIARVGDYMTTNEARARLDLPERDDVEDNYGRPVPEGETGPAGGAFGGDIGGEL